MTKPDGVTEWIGASPVARGAALVQLLGLADALPQGLRREGSPSLVEKVVAVDQALSEAGIPHAIGGAIALAYYGEPRTTVDIDVNVFIPVDRWPEVRSALAPLVTGVEVDPKELSEERQARLAWDRNPVHLFFSYDELHEEMPRGIRRVPCGGAEIPIVSPEHLVIRKATLDRTKDWLDIEAVLVACDALDLEEVVSWLARLAGPEDERVTKLHQLTARLAT